MNLGFDLDGVLYRWQIAAYDYLTKECRKSLPDYSTFWINALAILSEKEKNYLLENPILYDKMFPEVGIVAYLTSLSKQGHTLYYITARPTSVEITTELYLERYKFPQVANLIFSKEKDKYARLLEIDIFVEDQYPNAKALKDVCKVILRRQPWNEEYETEFDIIDKIQELDKFLCQRAFIAELKLPILKTEEC